MGSHILESQDTNMWQIFMGRNGFPHPHYLIDLFHLTNIRLSIDLEIPIKHNSFGQVCHIWFRLVSEDESELEIDVYHPCDTKIGDNIAIILCLFDSSERLEIPWIHGKPGLEKKSIWPIVLYYYMESGLEYFEHHNYHDDDNNYKEVVSDTVAEVYGELSKYLPSTLICKYCIDSVVPVSECLACIWDTWKRGPLLAISSSHYMNHLLMYE